MIFNEMLLYRSSVTDEVIVTITGKTVSAVYDGENHTITGYTVSINNHDYTESDFVFSGTGSATRKDVGTALMNLDASQFTNTNDTFKNVTFVIASDGYVEITPRPVSVTIVGASANYVYDTASHSISTYTASVSDSLYKNTDYTVGGGKSVTKTAAGVYEQTMTATNKNSNFEVTFDITQGVLTITTRPVLVSIVGETEDNIIYDGAKHSIENYTISISDNLYQQSYCYVGGIIKVEKINAGTYSQAITAANNDVNFDVAFNIVQGSMTIARRDAIVQADNKQKAFGADDPVLTATVQNVVSGDTLVYSLSRAPGEEMGSYTITASGAAIQGNYNVTYYPGTLTIGKMSVNVVIVGNHESIRWDGQSHTVEGYTATSSDPNYTTSDFTFSGTASVTRTERGTSYMGLQQNQFTNNNSNYNVTFVIAEDGYITITGIPVTVTITGRNYTGTFDNQNHYVNGYDAVITDSTGLYRITDFHYTGTQQSLYISRKDAGISRMNLTTDKFVNDNENFEVTFDVTDGFVQINKLSVTVTIVGNNDSYVYDGYSHSVSGYSASASSNLYNAYSYLSFSGNDTVSRTAKGTSYMGLASSQFTNTNDNFTVSNISVTDGYITITDPPYYPTVSLTATGTAAVTAIVVTDDQSQTIGYSYSNSITVSVAAGHTYYIAGSGFYATSVYIDGSRASVYVPLSS